LELFHVLKVSRQNSNTLNGEKMLNYECEHACHDIKCFWTVYII